MSLELIMCLVSLIFIYNGYSKGFLKQVSTLLSIIITFFIVKFFYISINNYLVENQIFSRNSSFFLKFLLIILGIFFL